MLTAIRFICFLLVFPTVAQAGDLLRIYEMAQRNDATFNTAQHARDAALESEPAARALLLPQLSGSYKETFDHANTSIGYTDPTTGTPVTLSQTNGGTDKNLSVILSQPLFNLESWYRLQQAGQQTALAQLNYRAAEQSLLLRVSEDYFGLLAAYDGVRSMTAEKEAFAHQLELAKQNLNVGLSSVTDVQDVQARYDLSVANELDAEQTLAAAREALEEITKEPMRSVEDDRVRVVPLDPVGAVTPTRLAGLREDATLPVLQNSTASGWVTQADLGNFDVLATLLNVRVAERAVDVAQSRYLPTVSGTVSYTDLNTKAGGFPTQSNGMAFGIGITVPLYSGGATRSAVREAVAVRDQRLSEYDGAQRLAERNASTAYQSVMIGAARIRAYKQAVVSSRSALEASQTGLEIGTRSAIDVLNAQQQRFRAERDYDRSRYDYLLAILRLKVTGGRLMQRDLEEIDGLLTVH